MVVEIEHRKVLAAAGEGSFREFEMALNAVKQEDTGSDTDVEYTSDEDTDAGMEDDVEGGFFGSLSGLNNVDIAKYFLFTLDKMNEQECDIEIKTETSESVTSVDCDEQQREHCADDADDAKNNHMRQGAKKRKRKRQKAINECGLCEKTFRDQSQLVRHMSTHSDTHPDHDVKPKKENKPKAIHQCGLCKKTLKDKYNLVHHMATHSDIYPFSCDQCGKPFKQERSLKAHKYYNHTPGTDVFHCSICDKRFKHKFYFMKHMDIHKGVRFSCNKCERSYSTQYNLQNHMKLHENEGNGTPEMFSCIVCQKTFMMEVNLKLHMQVHSGTQSFACETCDARFSRKADLQRHVYIHTGEYPYKCTECPRAFRQPGEFSRHKAWHRGDNTCKYCGRRYARKDELGRHVLKHEVGLGIKSDNLFQCHKCKKVYSSEMKLIHHLSNCTADTKVYRCETCQVEFTHRANVRRHIREQHPEASNAVESNPDTSEQQQFHCDLCDKTFKRKRALTEHINFVHLQKYSCKICDRNFYKACNLKRHIEAKHQKHEAD